MKSSASFHFSSASFFSLSHRNDQTAPPNPRNIIPVPIDSPSSETLTPIPVHLPGPDPTAAAVKIQSALRSHLTRRLVRTIQSVRSEADLIERQIRRQDTVDAVRRDERERLRVSEALMALLLRLDAVPGFYPAVRELRRATSRRIVGIQEVLDMILAAPAVGSEGFPGSLGELVEGIWREEEVEEKGRVWECRGFECLERFIMGM